MTNKMAVCAMTAATIVAASSLVAGASSRDHCIEVWPDQRGFDSMMPDAKLVRDITKELLDGTTAHLVVYLERKHSHAYPTFERHPREMFLFRTNQGRFVVRFGEPWSNAEDTEFPPDHGPY